MTTRSRCPNHPREVVRVGFPICSNCLKYVEQASALFHKRGKWPSPGQRRALEVLHADEAVWAKVQKSRRNLDALWEVLQKGAPSVPQTNAPKIGQSLAESLQIIEEESKRVFGEAPPVQPPRPPLPPSEKAAPAVEEPELEEPPESVPVEEDVEVLAEREEDSGRTPEVVPPGARWEVTILGVGGTGAQTPAERFAEEGELKELLESVLDLQNDLNINALSQWSSRQIQLAREFGWAARAYLAGGGEPLPEPPEVLLPYLRYSDGHLRLLSEPGPLPVQGMLPEPSTLPPVQVNERDQRFRVLREQIGAGLLRNVLEEGGPDDLLEQLSRHLARLRDLAEVNDDTSARLTLLIERRLIELRKSLLIELDEIFWGHRRLLDVGQQVPLFTTPAAVGQADAAAK